DNVGSDFDNLILSRNRAKSVAEYLIRNGISSNRLQTSGEGESIPVADNIDEEGRQVNRRVEFRIK
ncbi:MAG: OmpA family protein, partial [Saprospiraceae bacterium]